MLNSENFTRTMYIQIQKRIIWEYFTNIIILCVSSKVSAVKWKCWLVFNPVALKAWAFKGVAEQGNVFTALSPISLALRYKTSPSPSLLFFLFKFTKQKEVSSLLYPLAADQIKHSRCCNWLSAPCWEPCVYWFISTQVVTHQPWGQTDNHWALAAVFHPVIILIWDSFVTPVSVRPLRKIGHLGLFSCVRSVPIGNNVSEEDMTDSRTARLHMLHFKGKPS